KMTSSIFPPRRLLAPCSPMTQASASTTLDLPDPLGPTMQVMPGSRRIVVAEANDLEPLSVKVSTYMQPSVGSVVVQRCRNGSGTDLQLGPGPRPDRRSL